MTGLRTKVIAENNEIAVDVRLSKATHSDDALQTTINTYPLTFRDAIHSRSTYNRSHKCFVKCQV